MLEGPGRPPSSWVLFTDLYELRMAQAYRAERLEAVAVFELFFRRMPPHRNFVVAAGIADALEYLTDFRLSDAEADYLRQHGEFSEEFIDWLRNWRFTGDVYAVAEGTLVFPNEPIMQVIAPIAEAQIAETFLLNQVQLQSIAATKAARMVIAAQGRTVVDFGSRRAHGTDAALKVARASYLAGLAGTSNVLAGYLYKIPIVGTMAHSYVQAHESETEAFAAFARMYPKTTLLVDTYDTLEGVRRVIELCHRLGLGCQVASIRLDSGDLHALAVESRRMLDDAGLNHIQIFASGGLDEYRIEKLIGGGAPIDGFGVGTQLAVSDDAPSLDIVYKLVEYAGQPRFKLSTDKATWPGRKQVYRADSPQGMQYDVVAMWQEQGIAGRRLLEQVIEGGSPCSGASVPLETIRARLRAQLDALPDELRGLRDADRPYSVQVSDGLRREIERLQGRQAGGKD